MNRILYIDPQSYLNLSAYDEGILSTMNKDVMLIGNKSWDRDIPSNINVKLLFKYNKYKNPLFKGLSYLFTILNIIKIINKNKTKIIHIQWLKFWIVDYIFAYILKRKGLKIIFTAHNILPHNSGNKCFNKLKKYYDLVDIICVHSQTTKIELCEKFMLSTDKIYVIPHGVFFSHINDDLLNKNINLFRKKYKISPNIIVFSSLGLQSHYKGVDLLISVWSETKELYTNSNVRLILAGRNDGIDYSKIKNIKNVIIIDEFISEQDFQSLLHMSDLILLPYKKISQSGVLFSALGHNIPVLVSNIGGLPDPLTIADVGWNIGMPNFTNLRSCLLELLSNPEKIYSIKNSQEEFKKIHSYYSWTNISCKLKDLYENL